MRRKIKLKKFAIPRPRLENLPGIPEQVTISLDERINRCAIKPIVRFGQEVNAGESVGEGELLHVHASISGRVTEVNSNRITISRAKPSAGRKEPAHYRNSAFLHNDFPRFAASIGLSGMGGGMFPASVKLSASKGASTIVINCVECEPGVSIDESLLLENSDDIKTGVQAVAKAIGAKRIVVALKKSAKGLLSRLRHFYTYDFIFMDTGYPSGSERLILKKLSGKIPPSGIFPFQFGYLVQNTASVRAIGKAVAKGMPVIERPLTLNLLEKNIHKNVIVPVGTRAGELLEMYGCRYDADKELIIAGGLMMGNAVGTDFCIKKGSNAIFVISKKAIQKEGKCILCSSCFDVCPLSLHPILMGERIKRKEPMTPELKAQLDECFLCGACASVCPSDVQLIRYLKEGKEWMKGKK